MTDSLDDWLAANCRYLESAVKELPPSRDLPPLFVAMKDGTPLVFPDLLRLDKDLAIDLFRAFLKSVGAEQYAIIAAAWYVAIEHEEAAAAARVIEREGTGRTYKDQRRECYEVTVGDRERSLIALFEVERDYKGKIRRLVRRGEGPVTGMFGRMVDLLVESTRH